MDVSIHTTIPEKFWKQYLFNIADVGNAVDLKNLKEKTKYKFNTEGHKDYDAKRFLREGLTEKAVDEFRHAFDEIDEDGSGIIEHDELHKALTRDNLEESILVKEAIEWLAERASEKSIDFHEFMSSIENSAYSYSEPYKPLALIGPKYILNGRPFGGRYDI